MLIAAGLLVRAFAVYGILVTDGSVELVGIRSKSDRRVDIRSCRGVDLGCHCTNRTVLLVDAQSSCTRRSPGSLMA